MSAGQSAAEKAERWETQTAGEKEKRWVVAREDCSVDMLAVKKVGQKVEKWVG